MKSYFWAPCTLLLVLLLPTAARGQAPSDRYLEAYSLIEQADRLKTSGQVEAAVSKFTQANTTLRDLRRLYPDWNKPMVQYRLDYISSQLEPIVRKPAATSSTTAKSSGNQGGSSAGTANVSGSAALSAGNRAGAGGVQQLQAEIKRLRAHNALLDGKLREALTVQPAAADPRQLAQAEAQIRELQKEKELLVATLEQNQGATKGSTSSLTSTSTSSSTSATVDAREVRALNESISKLKASNQVLVQEQAAMKTSLQDLDSLRARLKVLEAKKVPYSAEELALFKQAEPIKVAVVETNAASAKKVSREIPRGAGPLVAEAQRAIDGGRYADAEKKYQEVLRQDENNVLILGNLAAVQLDLEKSAAAEETLKRALDLDSKDPMCLYLMGSLKLRKEQFDDALEYLSLSAEIAPDKPRTQFFLGKALIHQGNRGAAETALRKAIRLKPGWGEAHYLLSVLYSHEEPGFAALAKYHYKRAVAGGVSRNLDLEEKMEALPVQKPRP